MRENAICKIETIEFEQFQNQIGILLVADQALDFLVLDRIRPIIEEYTNVDLDEFEYIDGFIKEGGKLNLYIEDDLVVAKFKTKYNKDFLEYSEKDIIKVLKDLDMMFEFIVTKLP